MYFFDLSVNRLVQGAETVLDLVLDAAGHLVQLRLREGLEGVVLNIRDMSLAAETVEEVALRIRQLHFERSDSSTCLG